ncbi:MAG: YciI family protein [Anaerolineae bacterium]|nr:YciI family protein [Anaerolineae bacterium]
MKYMLLIYGNQTEVPNYSPEEFKAAAQVWQSLTVDMKNAGVLIDTNGLAPVSDATSVRVRNGKTIIADGPFAETHEQLGGFFLIDCKDLDEATSWAAKIPGAQWGTIEVRPLWSGAQ